MAPALSLFSVNAVIILNTEDGTRLFAKYYNAPHEALTGGKEGSAHPNPYPDVKSQKTFEKGLLEKTAKQTSDIILYDNRICLFKMESDVMIYIVGSVDENEVLLYNAILCIRDSLHLLFKSSVDKRTCVENYDLVSLAIDEIIDDGIILETDPTIIVQRVSKAPAQDVDLRRIDLSEQGVNNLAQLGKSKLADWLRQGL
ncbi:coatomer subunit zeta like protein [Verticillium longisporum]|uniref:Coatomer subunit zeta n=5 Tax=Verticillium TaxID=1036719 RepID=G2X2Q1_VERDV|nr:coatomer zeta subunit [Verticillium alfalfae VaMs.102]XP_009648837.1 coatomer zeta subunit [Verticillium dahliae VdLs.17]XP_028494461.1 Golgi-to-ER vesicle coat component [Verticillium nonalfalfae]KAF3346507.1 Protein lsb5 [Verticillium dahliae VDG2]KAF3360643.1 Histone H2B [Verticillium dahliae VDG1]KAG7106719.1 coatomer subunit zeta like protein [Verticillium longisporum]KAH6686563.1 coatomer zeta subunit [Verticillium dahliae]EEY18441.1 coatomer zeta subunit [Verticillium alfalfae VaMs